MSALPISPPQPIPPPTLWASPDIYRFTVDEYERMAGALEDPRVELLDGYLVKKMSKKPPHIWSVRSVLDALDEMLPTGWSWRKEDPVRIPDFDEPEPDVAVVRGSKNDYERRIPEPGDVALVVEFAESTLDRDQGHKLLAYAKGGIPVYWIVNLVDRQVEVYSDPTPEGYQSRKDFKSGQELPVIIEGVEVGRIIVADILPSQP
ncbi:MAG TPA: Uma2 family endonuclease [Isosphaeraceae bacterium]|nr:Uma2 family endonuclease [Isosphaeraceae bacterium]